MSRDWKPGTVLGDNDGNLFWTVEITENTRLAGKAGGAWTLGSCVVDADGNGWRPETIDGARPLVVIDPENPEQIERLAHEIAAAEHDGCGSLTCFTDRVQAALREFANPTPPKPDEPTGLGAVVEDADGVRWVRLVRNGEDSTNDDWKRAGYNGDLLDRNWVRYEQISAVRVLSEGVQS